VLGDSINDSYAVGDEDDEEGDGLGALLDLSSIEPFLSPPPQSLRRTGSTSKLANNIGDSGGGWGKNNNNISASGGSGDGGWDSAKKGSESRMSVRSGSDVATISKGASGGFEEQAFNAWQQQVSTDTSY
jgi:hypothetical protein